MEQSFVSYQHFPSTVTIRLRSAVKSGSVDRIVHCSWSPLQERQHFSMVSSYCAALNLNGRHTKRYLQMRSLVSGVIFRQHPESHSMSMTSQLVSCKTFKPTSTSQRFSNTRLLAVAPRLLSLRHSPKSNLGCLHLYCNSEV